MNTAGGHLGDRLSALVDAELSPDEEAAARAHLAACPACRSELEAVDAARSWLRALPPVDPPFGFYERLLLAEARPAPRSSRRHAGLGFAALAATAAAGLAVVGFASPRDDPVTPRVEQLVEAHTTAAVVGEPVGRLAPVGVPVTFTP